jgi:hypothetical protein
MRAGQALFKTPRSRRLYRAYDVVIVYGVEKPILHYPMVAIVAVIVATNPSLILQLAQPYVGDVSTTSNPLQEVVAVLSQPVP